MKANRLDYIEKHKDKVKNTVYRTFIKRILDLSISLISLILVSPILLIVAIAIKVTSDGPVLFKQERIGRFGEAFIIYKFRTMDINTPSVATRELEGGTNYLTPVGKFLRKTSLDELPQLFNIIKGDMSLIGPRPVITKEFNLNELRYEKGVFLLTPGITGLAQINGRDVLDDNTKVEYDLEYLYAQSFSYDIKIMIRTVIKVIKSEDIM